MHIEAIIRYTCSNDPLPYLFPSKYTWFQESTVPASPPLTIPDRAFHQQCVLVFGDGEGPTTSLRLHGYFGRVLLSLDTCGYSRFCYWQAARPSFAH